MSYVNLAAKLTLSALPVDFNSPPSNIKQATMNMNENVIFLDI
jgi:hypothetical protein